MKKRIAIVCGLAFYWPYFRNSYTGFFFAASSGLSCSVVVLFTSMIACGLLAKFCEPFITKLITGSPAKMLAVAAVTTVLLYVKVLLFNVPAMTYLCALALGIMSYLVPTIWSFFYCRGGADVAEVSAIRCGPLSFSQHRSHVF